MPRRKGGAALGVVTRRDYAGVKDILVPYRRVSTREQADSGAGLAAQRTALRAGLTYRQQEALTWDCVDKGKSGKNLQRPGLNDAMALIHEGKASGIIVSKLDRLSRSLLDFAHLMTRADQEGWNIVALDLGVDLATPAGKMMAGILAVFAEFERNVIAQRTRDGLAEKRAAGVILGRPRSISDELLVAIVGAFHLEGGYSPAARFLNAAGVPTVRGGKQWYPYTIQEIVRSPAAVTFMEQWEDAA